MSKAVDTRPLRPYSRSVSIIGVGATPFMNNLDSPETAYLGEGEMFGSAALEAMQDAGVTPKDIDYYFQGQAMPVLQGGYITPNMQVASWLGMKGRPSSHHSEACCTGYVALEQAAMAVAAGTYDKVLSGCCDMSYSNAIPGKPSTFRQQLDNAKFVTQGLQSLYAKDYTMPMLGANPNASDGWLDLYAREHGLSDKDVDDIMCALSINGRHASALNPRSLMRKTFEEEAAEVGMDSADEYVRSIYNPFMSKYLRVSSIAPGCDGAAAVIVCPTEMAYEYTDHPIEILGVGHSCLEGMTSYLEKYATEAAYKQVKELTGLSGKDMDLFMCNDFFLSSQLMAAEACEYIPEGEAGQYALEGRSAYDGDRPVNSHGGRCNDGHAHGTSGMHDIFEAVMQLRGEMGPTQIKNPDPKYAMLRGYGGGQNVVVEILKKL